MQICRPFFALATGLVTACAPARVVTTPVPGAVPGDYIRYAGWSDTSSFLTARVASIDADSLVLERFIAGDPAGRWVRGSLATDSIARLQVRVGRRGNPGRGALIGGLIGATLGVLCAGEESAGSMSPSSESCFLASTLVGTGTGLLFGALVRSDVWAPAALPVDRPEQPSTPAPVSVAPVGP
jgi:hypothetical protein